MKRQKNKPSFESFLHNVYSMSFSDYSSLPDLAQKAIEIDYINRYGTPTKWFDVVYEECDIDG